MNILTLEGEELSRVAGEVLGNHPDHDWRFQCVDIKPPYKMKCNLCDKKIKTLNRPDEPCKITDPIPLTWPEAMKYRSESDYYLLCLFIVWESQTYEYTDYWSEWGCYRITSASIDELDIDYDREIEFYKWAATKIQPEDCLKAALICAKEKV